MRPIEALSTRNETQTKRPIILVALSVSSSPSPYHRLQIERREESTPPGCGKKTRQGNTMNIPHPPSSAVPYQYFVALLCARRRQPTEVTTHMHTAAHSPNDVGKIQCKKHLMDHGSVRLAPGTNTQKMGLRSIVMWRTGNLHLVDIRKETDKSRSVDLLLVV